MAFFNLTYLGSQNPFNASSRRLASSDAESNAPMDARAEPCQDEKQEAETESVSPQSVPLTSLRMTRPKLGLAPHLPKHNEQLYSPEKSKPPYNGSHEKLTTLRTKHIRHVKGPMETYSHPVTTSQVYGWWIKTGGHSPTWAQNERHVHVNSQVTRFVDEMSRTNKDFSLF